MAEWFETFADERVLARARGDGSRVVVVFAIVSGALVAAAPLASFVLPRGGTAVAMACGGALLLHAGWLLRRLGRLHRAVWRVRLSARHLVTDDTRQHRTALPWLGVIRVDLANDALTVDGVRADGRPASLRVPADFAGHGALTRRVVDYAVAHRCVLCIDGEPLQAAPLDSLTAPTADHAHDRSRNR